MDSGGRPKGRKPHTEWLMNAARGFVPDAVKAERLRKQSTLKSAAYSPTYTMEEVAQHASASDCWCVFGGRVYDCTEYLDYHPGGRPQLLKARGADGSALFTAFHPWVNLHAMMGHCWLGDVVDEAAAGETDAGSGSLFAPVNMPPLPSLIADARHPGVAWATASAASEAPAGCEGMTRLVFTVPDGHGLGMHPHWIGASMVIRAHADADSADDDTAGCWAVAPCQPPPGISNSSTFIIHLPSNASLLASSPMAKGSLVDVAVISTSASSSSSPCIGLVSCLGDEDSLDVAATLDQVLALEEEGVVGAAGDVVRELHSAGAPQHVIEGIGRGCLCLWDGRDVGSGGAAGSGKGSAAGVPRLCAGWPGGAMRVREVACVASIRCSGTCEDLSGLMTMLPLLQLLLSIPTTQSVRLNLVITVDDNCNCRPSVAPSSSILDGGDAEEDTRLHPLLAALKALGAPQGSSGDDAGAAPTTTLVTLLLPVSLSSLPISSIPGLDIHVVALAPRQAGGVTEVMLHSDSPGSQAMLTRALLQRLVGARRFPVPAEHLLVVASASSPCAAAASAAPPSSTGSDGLKDYIGMTMEVVEDTTDQRLPCAAWYACLESALRECYYLPQNHVQIAPVPAKVMVQV